MKDKTVVIEIGNRFFYGFGKGGRVQTAWSLAGAGFFVEYENNGHLGDVLTKLKNKKIKFKVSLVRVVDLNIELGALNG